MSQISIEKVKLTKSEKLEIAYLVTLDDKSHVTRSEERDTKPHSDLVAALNKLAMHLAIISEYESVKTFKAANALKPFIVTGYSIGGKEDEEGVVITGYRLLKSGQTITLNTPFTRFEQDPKSAYYFINQLQEDIGELETEVLAYLDGTKKAPDPQMSIFPESNGAEKKEDDEESHEDKEDMDKRAPKKKNAVPKKKKDK